MKWYTMRAADINVSTACRGQALRDASMQGAARCSRLHHQHAVYAATRTGCPSATYHEPVTGDMSAWKLRVEVVDASAAVAGTMGSRFFVRVLARGRERPQDRRREIR